MLVVVASHNPVKKAAVRQAFADQFGAENFDLVAIAAESGVGDQPYGDTETRMGAINRATDAAAKQPQADFCVGLEGGVDEIDGKLMAFAWMAIRHSSGNISRVRSVTLPLPDAVRDLVNDGLELGTANDRVFSKVNSKQKGGAFGLLTNGRMTRESVYAQSISIALIPFVHESFSSTVKQYE
ncbi:MAG: inosine/xanthosine triphosphatase [Woeseiaceae bacterium]|jgi:inosine/xanthosine triphosphatase|nr:inosine/xanthosine triphosphatase [Woeseiaceae bacterium]